MIITLTIYIFIVSLIIFKGLYKSISFMKPFSVQKNTEFLSTSIKLESLPFYFNQGKINLFAFLINFLLLNFISLTLLPDLILNNTTYCQHLYSDNSGLFDRETKFYIKNNLKWGQSMEVDIYKNNPLFLNRKDYIDNFYKISNQQYPFIFHLNGNIKIIEPFKVFEGITEDFHNLCEEQKNLIKIKEIKLCGYKGYKNDVYYNIDIQKYIYLKNLCLMKLTSNAYYNLIFSEENNYLLKNTNLSSQVQNLNKEAVELSAILESINKESNSSNKPLYVINDFLKEERKKIAKFDINSCSTALIKYPNSLCFNDNCRPFDYSPLVPKPEGHIDNHDFIYRNINSFYLQFKNLDYYEKNKYSLEAIKDMGFDPTKKIKNLL